MVVYIRKMDFGNYRVVNFRWMLSKNWMDVNAKEQNLAIPHFERVPCENDDVILEYNKSYTIKMPRRLQMVKSIDNLNSKVCIEFSDI